jgi:hypothetical protein
MEESIKQELIAKMKSINTLLQEVNDVLGCDEPELKIPSELKLRFPRGYIRPASTFRSRLTCMKDLTHKYNISYQLMLSDLFTWLLNRTDIALTIREMIIKYEIVLMASVAETLKDVFASERLSFPKGLLRLLSSKKISPNTFSEANWLWNTRVAIHPFELNQIEHKKYDDAQFDRAVFAVRNMLKELNTTCP